VPEDAESSARRSSSSDPDPAAPAFARDLFDWRGGSELSCCPRRASSAGWSWFSPYEVESSGRLETCPPSCRGRVRTEAVCSDLSTSSFLVPVGPEEVTSATTVECFCSSYTFIDPATEKVACCLSGPSC